MIFLLIFAFNLSVPINYGQLSFNPFYIFETYSLIGDSSFPVIQKNLKINGFYFPGLQDVSLFFSKSFEMRMSPNTIEFLPEEYDSTITLLNSSKGTNSYTYAGLLFSGHYRPVYYSISADFASIPTRKISAFNPSIIYSNKSLKSRIFFYKFKRDSLSYIKTLFWDNTLLKSKKKLKFFYARLFPGLSVGGAQFSGQSGGAYYTLAFERTSEKENFIELSANFREWVSFGIKKPFKSHKIYPITRIDIGLHRLHINAWSDLVEDSVEIYRTLAGMSYRFSDNNYVFVGYGNSSSTGLFAGHNPFFAGKIYLTHAWRFLNLGIAGNFLKFQKDTSFNRQVNIRSFISAKKTFLKENYIELMGILDYFGNGAPHLSGSVTLLLFNSVVVRLEEINLTRTAYPFKFPENSVNFYRISVATYLKN